MPPDLHNDQELILKKRARRRLIGAIALVLLMVIILPRILQDRATLAPQETVKITMPEVNAKKPVEVMSANVIAIEPQADNTLTLQEDSAAANEAIVTETPVVSKAVNETKADSNKKLSDTKNNQEDKKVEKIADLKSADDIKRDAKTSVSKPVESKLHEPKVVNPKPVETKPQQKIDGSFTIQIGVFSDIANVKQLQAKLKQAGLTSHTEAITTPKGEKIRLKAGSFSSRQDAAYALTKLQAADLTGMVISND